MATEEERCAEAKKLQRIGDAFQRGDLDDLRAAVDDPAAVPNGRVADTIGSCLVYAIYHSPIAFIRTLLEIGADPNAPVDDGFPPLIAALSCHATCQARSGGWTSMTSCGCCCRVARTRISEESMTTHRSTWPSPSVIRARSKFFSTAAPIPSCGRGSTNPRRRSKWRRPRNCRPWRQCLRGNVSHFHWRLGDGLARQRVYSPARRPAIAFHPQTRITSSARNSWPRLFASMKICPR